MFFNLKTSELLIISLFFVTAINCALTYFCCSKSLKIFEIDKSINKAVNKLRIFDQYVLSKINLLISLFYFGVSYLFVDSVIAKSNYIFFFSCILSFIFTLITTFFSRLCYCYTCNVLLETKLNEKECFIVNFKRLFTIYLPFIIISLVIPVLYLFNFPSLYKNIFSIAILIMILIVWVILTPKIMVLVYNAKKIEGNTMLKYRLDLLMKGHQIKKYKLYYWDTSRSKESNAMVSGISTYHLFLSSSLIEDVTLPELETVITHEIGHIKNRHLIKMMVGKVFIIGLLIFMVVSPYLFKFNDFNKVLFYIITALVSVLAILISGNVERRYESEADTYAACYNDPELFESALRKIIKYEDESVNKMDEIFQSHPDIKERIERIKKGE